MDTSDMKCNLRVHNRNGLTFLLTLPLGYDEAVEYAQGEIRDDDRITHIDIVIVSEKVLLRIDKKSLGLEK
ncbi:MAG: hypothetical protein OPY03_05010 [Nitrosopumilus sp.]|nr:hypothetical protein [Nitrosopumilus sp.]